MRKKNSLRGLTRYDINMAVKLIKMVRYSPISLTLPVDLT